MSRMLNELTRESVNVPALEAWYLEERSRRDFIDETTATIEQLDEDQVWRATWLLQRAARDGSTTPFSSRSKPALQPGERVRRLRWIRA